MTHSSTRAGVLAERQEAIAIRVKPRAQSRRRSEDAGVILDLSQVSHLTPCMAYAGVGGTAQGVAVVPAANVLLSLGRRLTLIPGAKTESTSKTWHFCRTRRPKPNSAARATCVCGQILFACFSSDPLTDVRCF